MEGTGHGGLGGTSGSKRVGDEECRGGFEDCHIAISLVQLHESFRPLIRIKKTLLVVNN